MMTISNKRGFSLIELMIVVAILGILSAIAYPAYTSYVKKANRADAIAGLLSLAGRMEELYMNTDSYASATVKADGTGTVGSSETSEGLYTLSITSATAFAYTLTATPKTTDAECATLNLDSLGQKTATGTNTANCW
ncbi:MAG: type IV pilin protein [Gammaproteobacteria bacterium]|nr:type IV pilin protein [Gammaproteobacteria bacterium]